jgi:Predicted nucleic-acid-binding protein implicated in transcription termination
MRIVRTPSGDVILDETGRAAGRGAYICRSVVCLDRAITKGALTRALKTPLPIDLRDALGESLTITNTTIEGGARGQE